MKMKIVSHMNQVWFLILLKAAKLIINLRLKDPFVVDGDQSPKHTHYTRSTPVIHYTIKAVKTLILEVFQRHGGSSGTSFLACFLQGSDRNLLGQ